MQVLPSRCGLGRPLACAPGDGVPRSSSWRSPPVFWRTRTGSSGTSSTCTAAPPPLPAASHRHSYAVPPVRQLQQAEAAGSSAAGLWPDDIVAAAAEMAATLLLTASPLLLYSPTALAAAEGLVPYNPAGGEETLKTVAGVAYIGLVIFYFVRLFRKRAQKATTEARPCLVPGCAVGAGSPPSDCRLPASTEAPPPCSALPCLPAADSVGCECVSVWPWRRGRQRQRG